MATVTLSPFEQKTLVLLQRERDAGRGPIYTSAVGYSLWEQCDPAVRKKNPSPQGLALFAGRFLGTLSRKRLVSPHNGWSILPKGSEALAQSLDAASADAPQCTPAQECDK